MWLFHLGILSSPFPTLVCSRSFSYRQRHTANGELTEPWRLRSIFCQSQSNFFPRGWDICSPPSLRFTNTPFKADKIINLCQEISWVSQWNDVMQSCSLMTSPQLPPNAGTLHRKVAAPPIDRNCMWDFCAVGGRVERDASSGQGADLRAKSSIPSSTTNFCMTLYKSLIIPICEMGD